MRGEVLKWGNSLAVRIPKPLVDEAKLNEGDAIELEVSAEGAIQLHRVDKVPSLAELVAQITRDNRYGEVSTGPATRQKAADW